LGQPPEPYVVTIAMASVAAFLTPIGHHGNLLVYGPGRYQFADFCPRWHAADGAGRSGGDLLGADDLAVRRAFGVSFVLLSWFHCKFL
jgi:hypothetical protein